MTKPKAKASLSPSRNDAFTVIRAESETSGFATARSILGPDYRHAVTASQIHKPHFGSMEGAPGFGDYADAFEAKGDLAVKGDLAFASRMLAAQAMTLDSIFTEMARRMAINMAQNLPATETYARIALKAQANSRATLEALVKLHQPREQTVKHVHVNQGGQAVVADQFHTHTGGQGNGKAGIQPHATGTGASGASAALPCPDPLGGGVPIASREGETTVQDARRQG